MGIVEGMSDVLLHSVARYLNNRDAAKTAVAASRPIRLRALQSPHPTQLVGKAAPQKKGPLYCSAKRTHFTFDDFLMDHISLQRFMFFAVAFANGFVLENEPILEAI